MKTKFYLLKDMVCVHYLGEFESFSEAAGYADKEYPDLGIFGFSSLIYTEDTLTEMANNAIRALQ